MFLRYFIIFSFVGAVVSQTKPQIPDIFKSLVPQLQQQDNESRLKAIQEAYSRSVRLLCEKNGNLDDLPRVERAQQDLMDCVNHIADVNTLQKEIQAADETTKSLCKKIPSFMLCYRNMTKTLQLCTNAEETERLNRVSSMLDEVFHSLCGMDSDYSVKYIIMNGYECIMQNKAIIQNCVTKTVGPDFKFDYTNITNFEANDISSLQFKENECRQTSDLKNCVIQGLEECFPSDSPNIITIIFDTIFKAKKCEAKWYSNGHSSTGSIGKTIGLGIILFAVIVKKIL